MRDKTASGEKSPTKPKSTLWDHIRNAEEALILSLIVVSLFLPLVVPFTPIDAHEHSNPELTYTHEWVGLGNVPGVMYTYSFQIDIPQDVWDSQATLPYFRHKSWYSPSCSILIDRNNTYVKQIAEYLEYTSETYYLKIVNTHRFVHSLQYTPDEENYGTKEYWATPTETLAHRGGDCEDLSILLASLYYAMGIDCVLLYYPEHCSVAVRYDNTLYAMDPTATYLLNEYLTKTDLTFEESQPEIVELLDKKWIADTFRGLATYRYWIHDTLGI